MTKKTFRASLSLALLEQSLKRSYTRKRTAPVGLKNSIHEVIIYSYLKVVTAQKAHPKNKTCTNIKR